jgi:RNA ligase
MSKTTGVRLDAHHIIERRLWDESGGYYLDNGATLCDERPERYLKAEGSPHFREVMEHGCHMLAEQTVLTCDQIRQAAGITKVIIPEHLYRDNIIDKWGNIINPDGTRTPGELFWDESVRKVLTAGGVLPLFRTHIKYPRTFHLPWSPGLTDDDRLLPSTDVFKGREVVMTEKMDGENTTMYHDYIHARSLDSGNHPSRGWVKNLHGQIQHDIPVGWRLCGENLYAEHSIRYDDLPSYFMLFSIWDEFNTCLSWDDTLQYAAVLGLEMVPVLYRGLWDEAKIRAIEKSLNLKTTEGYTVRVTDSFPYGSFRKSIAKFVRAGHVIQAHNWMMKSVVKNGLKEK